MTEPWRTDPTPTKDAEARWAPWWVYLIVLLGANYVRSYFLPGGSMPLPLTAALAIGQAGLLFVIVTAIWRATHRGSS